jgi:hypothetical protein
MSDKMEKLVEQFFAKQEKVFGIEEINSFIKEAVLQEANFTVDRLYRKDYQDKWIDAISKGLDFIVDIPGQEKKKIKIDKSFADVLAKAAAEGEQSIDLLFKGSGKQAASVIPDLEGNKYKLTNISKEPFTGKKSVGGVTLKGDTNIKEGLVCYFYSLDSSILNQIEQKINTGANTKLNLDYGISTNPALMGEQATDKLKASIDFLSNQIVSNQEKDTYLNALSSARTVKNIAEGEIIDRGVLFNEIRKAGGMLTQQPPDKWSPGDVYLYKKQSITAIKQIISKSLQDKTVVNILNNGKIVKVGINSLFDEDMPLVKAISLKEQDAQHGRATGFITAKNIKGEEISRYQMPDNQATLLLKLQNIKKGADLLKKSGKLINKEEELINLISKSPDIAKLDEAKDDKIQKQIDDLIISYENRYQQQRDIFIKSLSDKKYGIGKIEMASSKADKQLDRFEKLFFLASKEACFEFMNNFLKNFEKLKNISDTMKQYYNPFLALTAYGVTLTGFNPSFYKVKASRDGKPTEPSFFHGKNTLSMSSESVAIIDSKNKAGFMFEFVTKMGEKLYTTRLDTRFDKGINISVQVDEFKENA